MTRRETLLILSNGPEQRRQSVVDSGQGSSVGSMLSYCIRWVFAYEMIACFWSILERVMGKESGRLHNWMVLGMGDRR